MFSLLLSTWIFLCREGKGGHSKSLLIYEIFSFAHLGDGENSWITDKCQGPLPLPLPPLDRTGVLHRPYSTPVLYYTGPIVHRPYSTPALYYIGPIVHQPYSTLALYYTGSILHWPYITPALYYTSPILHRPNITVVLYYTCLLHSTFNLTTNHGQNYRYSRPCLICGFVHT